MVSRCLYGSARTMTATEFRARCYQLMDEVAATGREVVITKRGGRWRSRGRFGRCGDRCSGGTGTLSRFTETSPRRLTWSGTPRPARTGLSHFDSDWSTGLNQLLASDQLVAAAASERLEVSTDRQTVMGEWTISATDFRARCYRLMEEVAEAGRGMVIWNRGSPWRGWRPIGGSRDACQARTEGGLRPWGLHCAN